MNQLSEVQLNWTINKPKNTILQKLHKLEKSVVLNTRSQHLTPYLS